MKKFDDEKIISDIEAQKYNDELLKQNVKMLETFKYFENKITVQNIMNIVAKILSMLEEETKLLNDLLYHITQSKQNETKVKINILQSQQSSLKLLYEVDNIQGLSFVKINQDKPLLKNAIDISCNLVQSYLELLEFELNTKLKEIAKKYIDELLQIILFLSNFLI